ncbi:MAG: PP2C family protein-serine/threonine phosphatase [Acidobacteriaceae bacterium]
MPHESDAERRRLLGLKLPLAASRARKAEEEKARAIQAGLLPGETAQLEGFQIASAWRPSTQVSGDYFDVFPLTDDKMALCIADVSGKGMAAVMLMSELHDAVRKFAPEATSPAELCTQVNQALCRPGAQTRYVTMFYGVLERGNGQLRYESAGHCLPLLVRSDGSVELLAGFSGVIGIFSHWLYQNQEKQLRSGDCLLLVTDGLLQAEGRRHEEFGYQRLIATVQNGRTLGAVGLRQEILTAVTKFCGGKLQDDASLIVVRVD